VKTTPHARRLLAIAALVAGMGTQARAQVNVFYGSGASSQTATAAVADHDQVQSCTVAGEAAERQWGIPAGLLAAIGRTESGRYDHAAGQVLAWPWTINAEGRDGRFDTKEDAIAAVVALTARGVRSIDVGCFQINLMHHAGAFGSLDEAFDPRANAQYAARFLTDLYARGNSWENAVAWYHSATPGIGEAYRDRVYADWGRGDAGGAVALPIAMSRAAPALPRVAPPAPGPATQTAYRMATQAYGVRVWTPGAAPASPPGAAAEIAATATATPVTALLPRGAVPPRPAAAPSQLAALPVTRVAAPPLPLSGADTAPAPLRMPIVSTGRPPRPRPSPPVRG
jgi:hypothetical protein